MSIAETRKDAEGRMKKSIESLKTELARLRTGRANASLLDAVMVEYYGSPVPLSQVASVSVSDARALLVTPWEKNLIPKIDKAIRDAGLGLNPVAGSDNVRVPLPPLSEERRKEMVKVVRQEGEGARVAIRNIRRDALFAFSTENWRRPALEVRLLMNLFRLLLRREAKKLHGNGVRLRIIGDRAVLAPDLQKLINDAETLTAENHRLTLSLAVNYGGRWDITQAARKAVQFCQGQGRDPAKLDEEDIARHLALADIPEPDLLIRTGGEERISNFLIWQLAYTEFYFTDTLWPDFDGVELGRAIHSFAQRQRRFGRTGDQVQDPACDVG